MPYKARHVFLFVRLFLLVTVISGQLYQASDLNLQYGNVLIENVEVGSQSSKIECAVICQAWKLGLLPCDAFIFKTGICQLIYIWSLTESTSGEMQKAFVRKSAIFEKCPAKIAIHSSDKFDCLGFESVTLNCYPNDYDARLVLSNDDQNCENFKGQVWLGQLYQVDQFIIFDLGCRRQVSEIILENSYCPNIINDGKLKINW